MLGVFSASAEPKPSATRRRCKPAVKAAPVDEDSTDDNLKEFEIVLHVFPQVKRPAGRNGKARAAKPEPVKFGPISATIGVDYDGLMDKFAKAVGTEVPFLNTSSIEWRWMKPANSQFVPLRDEDRLKSMLKHINSPPKGASGNSIIVKMDAPVKKPTQHMSWSGPDAGPSSVLPSVDDYESGDDGPKKKVPFDEGLEEEMEKLAERYPPGVCSDHPTISCFHDRLSDLHFELDRNRKIVWAAAIQRKATSLIKVPMSSNLFTAKKAIKKAAGPAAAGGSAPPAAGTSAPPVIPSTPASHPTPPQFPFWQNVYPYPPPMPGYPSFPPMPYPPPFPNYLSFDHHSQNSPWNKTPRRRRHRSWDGSSPPEQSSSKRRQVDPPSSPALVGGSINEFIAAYPNLPPGLKPLLQKLGFEIGDDITVITEAQWISADIPQFTAARIVKFYHKYKAGLCLN
ncbi:hypothetical protein B0H10DRAFT_2242995 [Mycena sp. CBHHK59/15]|nr:hypothetical protein B0H10DRAFT_2242995 [Mycena sp. CBHHK59/15]